MHPPVTADLSSSATLDRLFAAIQAAVKAAASSAAEWLVEKDPVAERIVVERRRERPAKNRRTTRTALRAETTASIFTALPAKKRRHSKSKDAARRRVIDIGAFDDEDNDFKPEMKILMAPSVKAEFVQVKFNDSGFAKEEVYGADFENEVDLDDTDATAEVAIGCATLKKDEESQMAPPSPLSSAEEKDEEKEEKTEEEEDDDIPENDDGEDDDDDEDSSLKSADLSSRRKHEPSSPPRKRSSTIPDPTWEPFPKAPKVKKPKPKAQSHFNKSQYPVFEPNALGRYTCQDERCDYESSSWRIIVYHMKLEHGKFRSECPDCGRSFLYSNRLSLHQDSDHGDHERPFPCSSSSSSSSCGRRFSTVANLLLHQRLEHSKKVKSCRVCGKEFEHARVRHKHVIAEHSDHPEIFPCLLCGIRYFTKERQLIQHIKRVHNGIGIQFCSEANCDYKTDSTTTLSYHLESHHPDVVSITSPFFLCSVPTCRLPFSCPEFAARHAISHRKPRGNPQEAAGQNGETGVLFKRKYVHKAPKSQRLSRTVCPRCGASVFNLATHLKTHRAAASLCDDCGKSFPNPAKLRQHRLFKHVDRSFPCPLCDSVLTLPTSLRRHMNSVHVNEAEKKRFPCPECGKRFAFEINATAHVQAVHRGITWPCSECPMVFDRKDVRNRHVRNTHKIYQRKRKKMRGDAAT